MADEAPATAPVDAPPAAATNEPTQPEPVNGESTVTKEDEETAGKQATTEVNAPDGDTTEVLDGPSAVASATDATPASGKKEKRKSSAGVPEHKVKKLNKKKSMPSLQLECKPGQLYWARLKGYPPWPAIICDEQMLPESLLASRPVSTTRPDGSLRDDFKEGGKNAKERTFPIMFLSTNEFSWMVNTALTPLEPEECKDKPKSKMTKALQNAYELAAEDHPLEYYKEMLVEWQKEMQKIRKEQAEWDAEQARLAEERAQKEAEEAAAAEADEPKEKKKKAPRKSKGGDDDAVMEDAEAPKSSKKRKKEGESDAEGAKPKKTPKVTKLNAPKTPNGDASAKKASKPKKKVAAPKADEVEEEEKPELTEAEKSAQREKAVLYLRHRLQKGFLSRDQAPQETEMASMAEFFVQLENYDNLEPAIIRTTKIHKVLKAIVKLAIIPKDEEYQFKKRSAAMLEVWNKRMEADGGDKEGPSSAVEPKSAAADEEAPSAPGAGPTTNGEAKEDAEKEVEEEGEEKVADEAEKEIDEKADVKGDDKDSTMQDVTEPPEAPVKKGELGNDAKDEAEVGDVKAEVEAEEAAAEAA
ncbi:hypothetical protein BAUCODRAFT_123441 [Baudoinia panamericana UAMH 10762]|uniref:PWWP domain-containing protein n=1 Tax=Baudoinia panamericana (strain UAMH 10762) TaxID=717646 RepID=M2N819_BAUPA|nr:uncharacterized protein BAUCODRAFT_123441 [Baudoinia panamericana UAMH 10762]EMC94945.1 hypothetical protein BAUCODRAFT_123441 [Baudoinia panamericana UAMH 10762]